MRIKMQMGNDVNATTTAKALARREATVDFDHAFGEIACTLIEIMQAGQIGGRDAGRLFDLLQQIEADFNTIRSEAE